MVEVVVRHRKIIQALKTNECIQLTGNFAKPLNYWYKALFLGLAEAINHACIVRKSFLIIRVITPT
jgi:hypothetical protein